jgi:hypothetical protein
LRHISLSPVGTGQAHCLAIQCLPVSCRNPWMAGCAEGCLFLCADQSTCPRITGAVKPCLHGPWLYPAPSCPSLINRVRVFGIRRGLSAAYIVRGTVYWAIPIPRSPSAPLQRPNASNRVHRRIRTASRLDPVPSVFAIEAPSRHFFLEVWPRCCQVECLPTG